MRSLRTWISHLRDSPRRGSSLLEFTISFFSPTLSSSYCPIILCSPLGKTAQKSDFYSLTFHSLVSLLLSPSLWNCSQQVPITTSMPPNPVTSCMSLFHLSRTDSCLLETLLSQLPEPSWFPSYLTGCHFSVSLANYSSSNSKCGFLQFK